MRSFFLTRYRKYQKQLAGVAMALATAAGFSASLAEATPVSITNPGFDTTVAGYGAFTGGPSLGWTSVGGGSHTSSGVVRNSSAGSAYLDDTGTLTQTLSATWSVGTYTLTGYAAAYTLTGGSSFLTSSLLKGATTLGSQTDHLNAGHITGSQPSANFEALTPVIVTILPTDVGIIGQPIKIQFLLAADPPFATQSYVEDIALDFVATPTPEPGSLGLMITGMAAMGIVARKRRKV